VSPIAPLEWICTRELFSLLSGVIEFLQVIAGCVTSHRVESLENLWSKLFSGGSFSNTPSKYSVKCPRGDKLFSESIGVVDLSRDHTSTSPGFQCRSEFASEG
jgi:hypothetical protein